MNIQDTKLHPGSHTQFVNAANKWIKVEGTAFAYRDIGPKGELPLVLLNHWGAVLDNFDPRIMDGLASTRRIIATDYRGIGASDGTAPATVSEMANRIPNSHLIIYEDAGHGGIFQHHVDFVAKATAFLDA
jgi:pimeloyl-ACP methyl ester carboxylesterase